MRCEHCSVDFVATGPRSRYCSKRCRPSLRRPCEVCGVDYAATYPKQRTCGRVCGVKLKATYICADCGGAFELHRQTPVTVCRLCARTRDAATVQTDAMRVYYLDCHICGVLFTSRLEFGVCSDECRLEAKHQYDRAYNAAKRPVAPRVCVCGVPLAGRRKRCDACNALAHRRRKRQDKRRRRAAKLGVPSERYTLDQIAVRDAYRCGLCRRKVRMTLAVPHPLSPTIDHVVPLADSGEDTRANVQLAHFQCNSVKCTGGSQQLALIG